MNMILLVGAADTGRAPMAAALLRRQLGERNLDWLVGSAGVLGHDDDPPETEARTAMAQLGLDIADHRARSVSDELIAAAALVVAIDSGTAKALRTRFPSTTNVHALGELAKRQRDIPDPFRMEIGAWLTYARELDSLLVQALPGIGELLGQDERDTSRQAGKQASRQAGKTSKQETTHSVASSPPDNEQRTEALQRIERLLAVAADMPEVIAWPAARARMERELVVAATPLEPLDLAAAFGGLLRAALALSSPTSGQINALQKAFARLERSISQDDLHQLSVQIAGWAAL